MDWDTYWERALMWWDETARQWRRHPDCHCTRTPCTCNWLRPLNDKGQSMADPAVDALRTGRCFGDRMCGCRTCREAEMVAQEPKDAA